MARRTGWAVLALLLTTACGGGGGGDASAASGPVLPGPQPTPRGAVPQTVTGTWGLNAQCVFLTAGYDPISPSFPKGWTFDASSKTVRAPDGSSRGRVGQRVAVQAVSLEELPADQVLCAGSAIQVVSARAVG